MTVHPIDTEALRRLADAATPGPWPLFSGGEYVGGVGILVAPDDGGVSPANAAFIAAARTAVPALLDALAAAEHRATRAEAQIKAAQDIHTPEEYSSWDGDGASCQECLYNDGSSVEYPCPTIRALDGDA